MSTFAALAYVDERPDDLDALARITAALTRSGDDGGDRHTAPGIALLHRLYATTREDRGRSQPITLDGAAWIAGDIRLDGRDDLAAQLRQHGHQARTDAPDAELVLQAYDTWGEQCAEHLFGDFGFALWDARTSTLLAVRDQFGTVPIHYAPIDGGLLLSNRIGAILAHPDVPRTPREEAIADFLAIGYGLDPARGAYEAVLRLPPGHRLRFRRGQLAIDRYWSPPADAPRQMQDEERIERFAHVLTLAVRDRLRTDRVPILLSGGIDSTLIAAIAVREGGRLEPLSYGHDWLVPDTERYFASLAARHLGLKFRSLSLDDWTLNTPTGAWRTPPEPRFSLRTEGGHLAYRTIAESGGRVILNGMGGDVVTSAPPVRWGRMLLDRKFALVGKNWWHYRRTFGRRPPLRLSLNLALAVRGDGAIGLPPFDWIAPDFRAAQHIDTRARQEAVRLMTHDPRLGMTDGQWAEILVGLSPEGTGENLHSLHPFFDVRLLREAMTLPLIPWRAKKHLLRRIAEPLLPRKIVERRKTPVAMDAMFEATRYGVEPAAQVISHCAGLDQYVDRQLLLERAGTIDDLSGAAYHRMLTRAAGLGIWLGGLAAS